MSSMFNGAVKFNQNLSGWNISSVTAYDSFGTNSALTAANLPKWK